MAVDFLRKSAFLLRNEKVEMTQFRFKSKSSVAIGTFNIYVIQPQSLAEMGVFENKSDGQILVSGDLTRPGIRFQAAESVWVVRPDRLSIESTNHHVNCGELLQRTLKALCWTPVVAIGANVTLVAPRDIEDRLALKLPECPGARQRTAHVAVQIGDSIVNVQLGQTAEELELHVNVHTDLSPLRNDPKQLSAKAVAVAGAFNQQLDHALTAAASLLNTEFVYE